MHVCVDVRVVCVGVYGVLLFFLFFFFKQKTAYEMRISDWSSDVCSSDLLGGSGFVSLTERAELDEGASLDTTFLGAGGADTRIDVGAVLLGDCAFAEIGRASCRERVCQYV